MNDGPRRGTFLLRYGVLAVLVPAAFALLASIRLTAQGVYMDELHQATGAFAWRGGPILHLVAMTVHGLPVLNMSYSGAIKTAIYGIYLRLSGREFTVLSWRLLGILLGAAALASLFLLAARRISPAARALLAIFLLTDTSLLLMQRHDYGPVALGFLLRCVFIGIWVRTALSSRSRKGGFFLLGMVAGVAVFEKLSSVVLLAPLLLAVWVAGRERWKARLGTAVLGLAVGSLPILAVNLYSLKHSGAAISLADVEQRHRSISELLRIGSGMLTLGSGDAPRSFVLGDATAPIAAGLEGTLLLLLLVLSLVAAASRARSDPRARLAVACAASYLLIGLAIWALPSRTEVKHWHWMIATPFQYVAIALVASQISESSRSKSLRVAFLLAVVLFVANRFFLLERTVADLANGRASQDFDPSLTTLGNLVRSSGPADAFIVADWGVSTQMFCLSNGAPDKVFEPYWSFSGNRDLAPTLALPGKRVFYVVSLKPLSGIRPGDTQRILDEVEHTAGLVEVPPDSAFSSLAAVSVRKFVRSAAPSDRP